MSSRTCGAPTGPCGFTQPTHYHPSHRPLGVVMGWEGLGSAPACPAAGAPSGRACSSPTRLRMQKASCHRGGPPRRATFTRRPEEGLRPGDKRAAQLKVQESLSWRCRSRGATDRGCGGLAGWRAVGALPGLGAGPGLRRGARASATARARAWLPGERGAFAGSESADPAAKWCSASRVKSCDPWLTTWPDQDGRAGPLLSPRRQWRRWAS